MQVVKEQHKWRFSNEERIDLGGELARALAHQAEIEAELDSIKQEYKAKQSAADPLITSLGGKIRNGFEMRSVECLVLKHRPETKQRTYVRLDTGRAVRVERMPEEDCQMTLTDRPPEQHVFEVAFETERESEVPQYVLCALFREEWERIAELVQAGLIAEHQASAIRKQIGDASPEADQ